MDNKYVIEGEKEWTAIHKYLSDLYDAMPVGDDEFEVGGYGCREFPAGEVMMEKRPRSKHFSKEQMSDYIGYILEFAAEQNIDLTMPDYWNAEY